VLKDILETEPNNKYNISEAKVDRVLNTKRGKGFFYDKESEKIGTLIAGYHKEPTDGSYIKQEKSGALLANQHKQSTDSLYVKNGRPCELKEFNENAECHHAATATDINGHDILKRVYADTGKSPTLNAHGGGNTEPKVLVIKEATKKGYTEIQDGDCFDATFPTSKIRRGRNMKDKSNCLTAANYDYMRYEHPTYRKLTPVECERLQTVPDGYTEGVSNSRRYQLLGNGWTVDVICHILEGIKAEFARKAYEKV